jgi:hypothetical protein
MHCPSCGNESDLDQKFCRKCGFNLAPVSKLMVNDVDTNKPELDKIERDKLLNQSMVRWMMWGMLAILIGAVFTIVGKQFAMDRIVTLIGSFFILSGVSIATYGVLNAIRVGASGSANTKLRAARKSLDLDKDQTTKQLEGRVPVSVPSVTERTTQLIPAEDAAQEPGKTL